MVPYAYLYSHLPKWAYFSIVGGLMTSMFGFTYVICEHFLVDALRLLSLSIGMPEGLAGATLLSLGNGAPEILNTLYGSGESSSLLFGDAVGCVLIIVTVVQGAIFIAANDHKIHLRPYLWGSATLLVTCLALFALLYHGRTNNWVAAGLIGVYVLYMIMMVIQKPMKMTFVRPQLKMQLNEDTLRPIVHSRATFEDTDNSEWESASIAKRVSLVMRSLCHIPERGHGGIVMRTWHYCLSPFALIMSLCVPDSAVNGNKAHRIAQRICVLTSPAIVVPMSLLEFGFVFDSWTGIVTILLAPVLSVMLSLVGRTEDGRGHIVRVLYVTYASILALAFVSHTTIVTLQVHVKLLRTSHVMAGLVLLAWRDCLPDLAASIAAVSRHGFVEAALSAVRAVPVQTTFLVLGLATALSDGNLRCENLGRGMYIPIYASAIAVLFSTASVVIFRRTRPLVGLMLMFIYAGAMALVGLTRFEYI